MVRAMNDLCRLSAIDAVAALRTGDVSPMELIEAAEERITEVEPLVNALPTTAFERARRHAERLAASSLDNRPPHHLGGLPIAVKDLVPVAAVRTTWGSRVHQHHIPDASDVMVETLEHNGGIVIAKSNTPEFGAGSHTFNEVFGHTNNPWDVSRSAGGSSGGAAAALATGEVWLADGSDLGGSLRNPASFCGVVAIRPSPGRVARGPVEDPWNNLSVRGPMGRTVADAALMLDAMVGAHPADPLSLPAPDTSFLDAALRQTPPRRIAFSPDLGGITPVDPEVASICRKAVDRMADDGVSVEETSIDFSGAAEIFRVLRALVFTERRGLLAHRDVVKPEVIENIEAGLRLTPAEIASARSGRGDLLRRAATFFEEYDLLACPAAVVAPFPGQWRWPTEVADQRLDSYIDWLLICAAVTLTSCPALSVPCGFTAEGLPVGLQLVAALRAEHSLISAAAWWQASSGLAAMVPRDPATT